jgi:hypothetical protein
MSLPISEQKTVGLHDYFTIELQQLKKNPVLQEHLTEDLPRIFAAIANREPTVELDKTRIDLQKLDTIDLLPLMEVANRFFSTQHEGLLNSTLLENLYTIEKRYPLEHFKTLVKRTETALTINNEPHLQMENTQGIKAVKNRIIQANEQIKKTEKQRKYAKIGLIVSVSAVVIGVVLMGVALGILTVGVAVLPAVIGGLLFATGSSGIFNIPATISHKKSELDYYQKQHTFWTYVLTFSQTEEFKEYQASLSNSVKTIDSITLLEAAALTHLKSKNLLETYQEKHLTELLCYAYSKTKEFDDFKNKYASSYHSDHDFIKFAYLESLDADTRKQTTEYEELLKKFSGG